MVRQENDKQGRGSSRDEQRKGASNRKDRQTLAHWLTCTSPWSLFCGYEKCYDQGNFRKEESALAYSSKQMKAHCRGEAWEQSAGVGNWELNSSQYTESRVPAESGAEALKTHPQ